MLDYLKPQLKLVYGVPGISEIEGGWYCIVGNFHKVDILCFFHDLIQFTKVHLQNC